MNSERSYVVVLLGWMFCRRLSSFGLSGSLSGDIQSLSELVYLYVIYSIRIFLIFNIILVLKETEFPISPKFS